MAADYRSLFQQIEGTLFGVGAQHMPIDEIRANLEPYKHFEHQTRSDDEYFRLLVSVIFYSGFRAAIVTAKLNSILARLGDYQAVATFGEKEIQAVLAAPQVIGHQAKIRACVYNAREFARLVHLHGSIRAYIDSFAPRDSFENLLHLREDLQHRFKFLGGITAFHLMTDIGLPVLKPDRVIRRIFYRLGLIESESEDEVNLLKAIEQGTKFVSATGHPIRYIDIVLVAYGQVQSNEFGLASGICLKDRPLCELCGVRNDCGYFTRPTAKAISPIREALSPSPIKTVASMNTGSTSLGPYPRSRIVVCSGDASPHSQASQPTAAGRFFPGAKWVAAMRNAAQRLGCRFVILTTGHGLVTADDVIAPYDLHIKAHRAQVREVWNRTIPGLLSRDTCDLVVFHAGGCPAGYVDELWPTLQRCGISLLVFGRPNMVDVGRVDQIINAVQTGAVLDELQSGLTYPTGLKILKAE